MPVASLKLSRAKNEDFKLFHSLRSLAMREHVERLHSWNGPGELAYHKKVFNPTTLRRIVLKGKIIGFVNLRPADYQTISLGLFCIDKEYRNMGLGTQVMRIVLSEPPCLGKCVFLNVLKGSPAIRLYKRFGFKYSHSDSISDYFKRLATQD